MVVQPRVRKKQSANAGWGTFKHFGHLRPGASPPGIGSSNAPMLRARWIVLALLATASCDGCRSEGTRSPACTWVPAGFGPAGSTRLRVEVVASGLEVPWGIAFVPGGDWLVTERPGRVRLVHQGQLQPDPVVQVQVAGGDEGGVLGIALDPAFAANRYFFIYATVPGPSGAVNRVLRYLLSEDHRSASLDRVVIDGIEAAKFHDGGRLRIGPDGMLYVGTGDARNPSSAQKPASLNGKILRYRPDGSVPPDNPRAGSPVYISGIRNTEGFDWLDTGAMVIVDHGPSGELGRRGQDEVNVARAGDNLGWPQVSGCDGARGKVSPLLSWKEAVPPGGAAVYRGSSLPGWSGNLVIGTLGSKHLHRVVFANNAARVLRHETYLQGDPPAGYGRLREAVMGPDQQLYVTTSNCDGRGLCPSDKDKILRIGSR